MRRFRTNRRPGNRPMSPKELEFVMEAKFGPCMACLVRSMKNLMVSDRIVYGCDFNHCKSGNIRRGHLEGFACCPWHHRAVPIVRDSPLATLTIYGPSLMHGGKTFAEAFGGDNYLIQLQREHLGWSPDA